MSDLATYLQNLPVGRNHVETSVQLSEIVKKAFLHYTDIETDPEKFFECHRMLSFHNHHALGIKFTAQYNLFAGTILFLGNMTQRENLIQSQSSGLLGCFALTEKSAGVMSGFIVSTTAVYNPHSRSFTLNSNDPSNSKTWISQGLTAQTGVVFADLIFDGQNKGPHAFLLSMKTPGVHLKDMGLKTDLNALDNAEIFFDNVCVPYDALLSRYTQINENNEYQLLDIEKYSFITIAQRLLTGRFCIAEASLAYFEKILDHAKYDVLQREILLTPSSKIKLIEMPMIRDHLNKVSHRLNRLINFNHKLKKSLISHIRAKEPIPLKLIEQISISKISCTDFCTNESQYLRQLIGSQSLMKSTNLNSNLDIFYCTQFAEGDNKILKQKITKDWLSIIKANPQYLYLVPTANGKRIAMTLLYKMWQSPVVTTWMENYELVNAFANIIIERELSVV
jgi:acyl-CoA oxidase